LIIEKLRGHAFGPLDVLEMNISVDTLCPIGEDEEELLKSEYVVKVIESAITSGPQWQLNPSCRIFMINGVFNFQKEILINDIAKNGIIKIQELDVHRNAIQILYPIKLFLVNARTLSDELILKSEAHIIHTLFGKITL